MFSLPLLLFSHLALYLTVHKNFHKFLNSVILVHPTILFAYSKPLPVQKLFSPTLRPQTAPNSLPLPLTPNRARPSARSTLQLYQPAYMQILDTDHCAHGT
jgi:hypothetical protein